jgi:hypothetical protein
MGANFAVSLRAPTAPAPGVAKAVVMPDQLPRALCDTWAWIKWDHAGESSAGLVLVGLRQLPVSVGVLCSLQQLETARGNTSRGVCSSREWGGRDLPSRTFGLRRD